MTDRSTPLLAAVAGVLAVGLIWWSPTVGGDASAPSPPEPRFGPSDVRAVLLNAIPAGEEVLTVRGRITPRGDVAGVVATSTHCYRVRVSGEDGSTEVHASTWRIVAGSAP